jgi:hypothetical protein
MQHLHVAAQPPPADASTCRHRDLMARRAGAADSPIAARPGFVATRERAARCCAAPEPARISTSESSWLLAKRRPDDLHGGSLLGQPCEGRGSTLVKRKLGEAHEELLELRCPWHQRREEPRGGVTDVLPRVRRSPWDEMNKPAGASKLIAKLDSVGPLKRVDELVLARDQSGTERVVVVEDRVSMTAPVAGPSGVVTLRFTRCVVKEIVDRVGAAAGGAQLPGSGSSHTCAHLVFAEM